MGKQSETSTVGLVLFLFFFSLFLKTFFYFFGEEVTRADMEGLGSEWGWGT